MRENSIGVVQGVLYRYEKFRNKVNERGTYFTLLKNISFSYKTNFIPTMTTLEINKIETLLEF